MLLFPGIAGAQSLVLHGSAGPTLSDAGHSLAAGVGFSAASRVTFSVEVERTKLSSRLRNDGRGGVAGFRGGTFTMVAAELRVALLGPDRAGPYGLVGLAAGISRPNVTDTFPDRVTNDVRATFFGGGVRVPLGHQMDVFADARMIVGAEAGELLAIAPVRAGIAWRF